MTTTDPRHSAQAPTNGGNHVIHAYEYADAAARTGAIGFVTADLGKVARQLDTGTFWLLTATTPTWVQLGASSAAATPQFNWGNGSISGTTTTRYLTPEFDYDLAPTSLIQIQTARAGTLQNFRIHVGAVGGNANNVVYTLRKNGVATALVVTMAANATSGSDLTHTVSVVAGDLLDIEITKASSIASSPTDVFATCEFA